MDVYLEIGHTRMFAMAADWPGWCRSGRDEASALQALRDYAPRYARVVRAAQLQFRASVEASAFSVVERLAGTATTDFGAPDVAWPGDRRPVGEAELARFKRLLKACWTALDAAERAATGRVLRKGPRGGGRDLAAIMEHVQGVDDVYLARLGGKLKPVDPSQALSKTRQAILATLVLAAQGEVPERGSRGGLRWTPRYFVRRLAWHELDHAWEIEDRAEPASG